MSNFTSSSPPPPPDVVVEEEFSGSGIVKTMVVFCSTATVVFGIIYVILWRRGKTKHENFGQSVEAQSQTQTQPRRRQYTQEFNPNRERRPGVDPVYDRHMVGGTASLGVLLWVGSTIVLAMMLGPKKSMAGAQASDFVSLGPRGCRVNNTSSYSYEDDRLNARNTRCVETWEYNVRVNNDDTTYFVPAPQSHSNCRSTCQDCLQGDKLLGPGFYAGLDPLRAGQPIDNETYVECWAPTVPVERLSGFYDCGKQSSTGTCYLLQDTSVLIEQGSTSWTIGLVAALAGYVGGVVLLMVVAFFVHRNKQVKQQELAALQLQQEGVLVDGDTEVASTGYTKSLDNNVVVAEEEDANNVVVVEEDDEEQKVSATIPVEQEGNAPTESIPAEEVAHP